MREPDLSILIVGFQCGPCLARCLQSVFACVRNPVFEVVVVDNGSTDGSVAEARRLGLPMRWILSAENLGFARANNLAAGQARGRYFLLLNPDTELTDDCVTPLLDYAESHPEAGLVGGGHEDANGRWQRSFGPPVRLRDEYRFALLPQRVYAELAQTPPDGPIDVGWLAGSFLLIRAAVARRVGLFDPEFFLNDEDIDLAMRVRQAGWGAVYLPTRGLRHWGGISKAHLPGANRAHFRSRLRLYRKHYGLGAALLFGVSFLVGWTRGLLRALVRRGGAVEPARRPTFPAA